MCPAYGNGSISSRGNSLGQNALIQSETVHLSHFYCATSQQVSYQDTFVCLDAFLLLLLTSGSYANLTEEKHISAEAQEKRMFSLEIFLIPYFK